MQTELCGIEQTRSWNVPPICQLDGTTLLTPPPPISFPRPQVTIPSCPEALYQHRQKKQHMAACVTLFCVVKCMYRPPDRMYSLFFLIRKHNISIKHTALGRKGGRVKQLLKKNLTSYENSCPATPLSGRGGFVRQNIDVKLTISITAFHCVPDLLSYVEYSIESGCKANPSNIF